MLGVLGRKGLKPVSLLVAVFGVMAQPAAAEVKPPEWWHFAEARVLLPTASPLAPQFVRLNTTTRMGPDYPGLGQAVVRGGAVWKLAPWLSIGANLAHSGSQAAAGNWTQDTRLELDPMLSWRLDDWTLLSRQRLGHRWMTSGNQVRYRHRVKMTYQPDPQGLGAWLMEELFVNLTGARFDQNWVAVGTIFPLYPSANLELGLGLRSVPSANGWAHTPFLMTALQLSGSVTPPEVD